MIDHRGREVIDALFDGREQMVVDEARIQTMILKAALIGMLAARTTAYAAGDVGGDEGSDASE